MKQLLGLVLCLCLPSASLAQRMILVPGFGGGETIEYVREVPGHMLPFVEPGTKIGFMYWYFCVGSHHFKFWTADGRFVLCDPKRNAVWDLPEDELLTIMGTEAASTLRRPWSYYVPGGQWMILGIMLIILIVAYFHRKKEKQVIALDHDPRYQEALVAYGTQMPQDRNPSIEEREGYLHAATADLVKNGIDPRTALRHLRTLVASAETTHAHSLRDQAVEHAEAEEWDEAATLFLSATQIMEMWNRDDAKLFARRGQECLKMVGRELSG